jgi:small subunit ribosomal protein S4
MGDIRKPRKKYQTPSHPWQKGRLDEEGVLVKEYALKNKKEVWKMQAKLKHFTSQAKFLTNVATESGANQRKILIQSMANIGLLNENATIDDVLNLGLRDIMERRLQTIVLKKGFARTMNQARQFIVHKHVAVGTNIVSVPSYLVKKSEDPLINFVAKSSLSNPDHPERFVKKEGLPKQKPVERQREKSRYSRQKAEAHPKRQARQSRERKK